MLLARVVAASTEVAATSSRRAKVAALAAAFRDAGIEDVPAVTAWLAGEMLQGRTGVGWRLLRTIRVEHAAEPTLTVAHVDATLDRLGTFSGRHVTRERTAVLAELFAAATTDEAWFLVRLIGGELRQGALEGLMVEGVAAAAEVDADAVRRTVMLSGRLPATAALAIVAQDPAAALAAVGLEVGRPVRPMLASPGDSLDDALAELGSDVVVEQKMDGARIQVHRDGDEVRVWSRTLRDLTDTVPEVVSVVRALPVTSVVLDGETLALGDDGRPRPFQQTMSRFGQADLRPWFFDCLHRDGVDLVDEPLSVRRAALAEIAPGHVVPGVERPSPAGAAAAVEASIAAGHEGSMVKALTSVYAAGRRGRSWQKVKPVHTLDLVVLAVEWGSGRRRGLLSNIHLGARATDGSGFVMVGKTFKGMTDETLAWQTATFPAHETHREKGVLHLRPRGRRRDRARRGC